MSSVKEKLAEKLEGYYGRTGTAEERYDIHVDMTNTDKALTQQVKESIGAKFDAISAVKGTNTDEIKRKGLKYYGEGISNIIEAEKKTSNLLSVAKDELNEFIESEIQKYMKILRRSPNYSSKEDSELHDIAEDDIYSMIAGNTYKTDNKAAKEKFRELYKAYGDANTEYNAVLLAKQDFINENSDLIEEARREKRLRELKKSGILENLDLVEKTTESEENEGNENN